MKNYIYAALATATLAACETTIPANDTTDPVVTLQISDGGWKSVASTDPNTDLDTGCPVGTSASDSAVEAFYMSTYGATVSWSAASSDAAYFYGASSPPFEFWLTTNDAGGAALGRISFNDNTISASQPEGTLSITDIDGNESTYPHTETRSSGNTYTYRRVEITGDASDPRTALLLIFEADGLGTSGLLSFRGEDFSGNAASQAVWLLPRSLCQ